MNRTRRSPWLAIALAVLLPAVVAPVAPAGQSSGRALALVDIDEIGFERLAAIRSSPEVAWWVELDRVMLVAAPRDAVARGIAGAPTTPVVDAEAESSSLYVAKRIPTGELERAGARVVAAANGAAILLAAPDVVAAIEARVGHEGDEDGCHAHASIAPLAPNTVLQHQAKNSRIAAPEYDVSIDELVASVDGDRWYADIQQLATYNRYTRGSDIANARNWLVDQFSAMPGLEVSTQSFTVPNGVTAYNVIAKLPGAVRPDDWYIIGAHYDAISSNDNHATAHGAEDNGSGTAGVLELARIFTAHPPDATVYFICYAGEEQGLYGSTAHASSLVSSGDSARVKAMYDLDMIGYTGDADLDCLLETRTIGQFISDECAAAAAEYTTLRIVTSLDASGSDHVPYLNRNMPALLAIENDYSTYPSYHRSTDLPNNITIAMGEEILKMSVAAMGRMMGPVAIGNGNATVGVYDPAASAFFLRNANTPGGADATFSFGGAGAGLVPLAGDWDGDGADTIGLYDPATSTFFLRNANSAGAASLAFSFGAGGAGLVPLAGDWNGDGIDTIGLYDPATAAFFLRNANSPGGADVVFTDGPVNATPLAGDWNGDGATSVGVYVPATGAWFLRNANSPGPADVVFTYGAGGAGLTPLVGDWNDDLAETVGLYDGAMGAWFLRNANTAGGADAVFGYGPAPGMRPVTGDWNDQ
jgi:hypothetical protein